MKVILKNEAGFYREIKVGVSWTPLILGPLPLFCRGMWYHGILWGVLALLTSGFSGFVLIFIINRMTARYYLNRGYEPFGEGWDIAGPKWDIDVL